jgi:hypothetical protein
VVTENQTEKITGYNCATLAFRAYSPVSFPSAYDDAKNFLQNGDQLQGEFHFNMTQDGETWTHNTTPVSVAEMRDICFAQKTSANSSGAVELIFHHAFSQIVFKAKKTSNYQVDIKSIQIGGIKYSGGMNMKNLRTIKPGVVHKLQLQTRHHIQVLQVARLSHSLLLQTRLQCN